MKVSVIAVLLAAPLASAAFGQDLSDGNTLQPAILRSLIQPGMTLDGFLAAVRKSFRNLDANADGALDVRDADLHEGVSRAGLRAGSATQIMAADLDGDGSVTEIELRAKRVYDLRNHDIRNDDTGRRATAELEARLDEELRRTMSADTDRNGSISWQEAAAFGTDARRSGDRPSDSLTTAVREIIGLAGGQTQPFELARFEELAGRLFRGVDSDGNGTISQDEFLAARRQGERRRSDEVAAMRERRAEEARAGCELPKPSGAATVVLLSAYGSEALSKTAIGSQDVSTGTATIAVEPGTGPLYVVVTAFRPVIWRFAGAVERVERVVLAAQITGPNSSQVNETPLAGATGIPAGKITFLPRSSCLGVFTELPSVKGAATTATVRRDTGKEPVVASRYEVAGFSIPSAAIRVAARPEQPANSIGTPGAGAASDGGAGILSNRVARVYPGGTVEIDPATVVASAKPSRYEVLPGQAGLLQLVQSGALAMNQSGEFVIKAKIRLPAELNGLQASRFLLLRGVPIPEGNAGHSCIMSEETGTYLRNDQAPC